MNDDMILWYAPDGSYGVCERKQLVRIPLDRITEAEHRMIDSAEWGERDLMRVLDEIMFRIVNEDMEDSNVSY